MKYVETVNIWNASDEEIAALQPGQWVRAGTNGPRGQWCGLKKISGVKVVAWFCNRKTKRGYYEYFNALRNYAKRT